MDAVAVIDPWLVAFTLIIMIPAASVVPFPVATPVRSIVALLTAVPLLVTMNVTLVGIPTVIVVGFVDMINDGWTEVMVVLPPV